MKPAKELAVRIEVFLNSFRNTLKKMTEEEFKARYNQLQHAFEYTSLISVSGVRSATEMP